MNEYKITDFRMAGFLLARGVKFLRCEKNQRKETVFVFCNENKNAESVFFLYPGSPENAYDHACKTMYDMTKMVL